MSLFNTFTICGSGMAVQRARMDTIAENIANISSTSTPEGGPYKPKEVIISTETVKDTSNLVKGNNIQFARVANIINSERPPLKLYDPSHPDADENGFVEMPDISSTEEMIKMMSATNVYEANMTTYNAAKTMVLRTLELGEV